MILVITGSGGYPFDRMLNKVDDIASRIPMPFLIQDGPVRFAAKNCRTLGLMPYRELMDYYRRATLIVSHTSSGPLIYAKKFGKPIISLPRRSDLGEAVDDHQVETAAALQALPEPSRMTLDGVEELEAAILTMLASLASGLNFSEDKRDLLGLQAAIRQACFL